MGRVAGDFAGRAGHLEQLLAEREVDALLVTDLLNVRYLCGFTGTNGLCVAGRDLRVFITDFRYDDRAERELREFELRKGGRDVLADVVSLLDGRGELRLGFDDAHVSVRQHAELAEKLPGVVELVPAGGLVEQLRAVKDDAEVAAIRAAAAIASTALERIVERGVVGRAETEVARDLAGAVAEQGADDVSFPVIVAAAANGAIPHAEPRDVKIARDALVVFDLGAVVDSYCSDMTRTLATGEPGEDARKVYETVLEAQARALAELKPGVACCEIDRIARDVIAEVGYGENFGHGLGHGVGLDVHEGPTLSVRGKSRLEAGNVVTVEPGIYLPGRFGVRIEDLVVVTEDGQENLSRFPKDLTVVG